MFPDDLEVEAMAGNPAAGSQVLSGEVGRVITARELPLSNVVRDPDRYPVEGDWVFCVLDHPRVRAARFGFTRGPGDYTDYGAPAAFPDSWLQLHIEFITDQGDVLWHAGGLFDAAEVKMARERVDLALHSRDGRQVFHVAGWPNMRWVMACPDADVSLDLALEVEHAVVLPDACLPRMRFGMWWSAARVSGRCRVDGTTHDVSGRAFYDHPRIIPQRHDVPLFGFYHYTPIALSDGSTLCSYHSRDREDRLVPGYSFAYWLRSGAPAVALRSVELHDFNFDHDGQPAAWVQRWEGPGVQIIGRSRVQATPIRRIWGGPAINRTRQNNPMIPLLFDADVTVRRGQEIDRLTGRGLAEFVMHPQMSREAMQRPGDPR
jgi:hypothetical protein